MLAQSLREGLERARMSVDVVHDGQHGVEAAWATSYDVIVLDVLLPGLDGFGVSAELRRLKVGSPILMLTGLDSVDDRIRGLESGADDYVVKPFALREVIARIRALSRRHLPDRSGTLTAGPICLHTDSHEATVNGRPLTLTGREFQILELFMLHRGQLLSRSQVLERIWSVDFEGGRNLVEVYVARLRHKLIEAGGPDPFVTVRGIGYRLTG